MDIKQLSIVRLATVILGVFPVSVSAQTSSSLLADMELEDLMKINVTTVTKRKHSLGNSAAAVYIISQEDIRRSGATVLPEVLDLAPNIQAERTSRAFWSVASRGMLSQYSDKLLVMVDGRSVYNPLFGGVNWENVLPSLNEIEQIEIIAGPGTSIWGANSINGIINIITYDSEITQHTRVVSGIGNEEEGFVRLREAFQATNFTGRVNLDYRRADEGFDPERDSGANDAFSTRQISTRLDWKPSLIDTLSWDAGYTKTSLNGHLESDPILTQFMQPITDFGSEKEWGMATWLREIRDNDNIQIKAYIDREDRTETFYDYNQDTLDVDLQYSMAPLGQHQVTAGIAARRIDTETVGTYVFSFSDDTLSFNRHTAFIQDEFAATDQLTLTAGIKYEDNEYVDPEFQPTLRAGYALNQSTFVWAAWSHAARTPGGIERVINWKLGISKEIEQFLDTLQPGLSQVTYINIVGDDKFQSELVDTYETGIRKFFGDTLSIDFALYHSNYDQLRHNELVNFSADEQNPGYYRFFITSSNEDKGSSTGGEILIRYRAFDTWHLTSAYSRTELNSTKSNNSTLGNDYYEFVASATPKTTAYLLSQFDYGNGWEFDCKIKYVDKKYALTERFYPINAYYDFSTRLGKRITPQLTLSLVGKQWFDSARSEIIDTFNGRPAAEIERSIFVQVEWE